MAAYSVSCFPSSEVSEAGVRFIQYPHRITSWLLDAHLRPTPRGPEIRLNKLVGVYVQWPKANATTSCKRRAL